MTRPRLIFFARLLPLLALIMSAGCVTTDGTSERALPADWKAALPQVGTADFAGVYVERGERLDAAFARDGTVGHANLSTFISPDIPSRRVARQTPARGATTELRKADANHFELITRTDGEETGRALLEFKSDPATGTITLSRSKGAADLYVVGNVSLTLQLWRAADGRLYVRGVGNFVGGIMLVPTLSSKEVWCRWDPATPDALQRQAAEVDTLNANKAREIALNAARPKVGETAPSFEGSDGFTGRPIRLADYRGKVLVLYVWSTTEPRMGRPVRSVYGKYHERGLDVVGLCKNTASEKGQVVEFLRSTAMPGAQLYDGEGMQGKVFETYFGATPGYYCVIDRQGVVAAVGALPYTLEDAVKKLFASP